MNSVRAARFAAVYALLRASADVADHWVNAARTVSTMSSVSVPRLSTEGSSIPLQATVSRSCGVTLSLRDSLLWAVADGLHR